VRACQRVNLRTKLEEEEKEKQPKLALEYLSLSLSCCSQKGILLHSRTFVIWHYFIRTSGFKHLNLKSRLFFNLSLFREEQRHVQKRKKRRVRGPSSLSFADEVDGDTDEEGEAAGT
jgi:hypothetical protein